MAPGKGYIAQEIGCMAQGMNKMDLERGCLARGNDYMAYGMSF
jgi:hypothetical protein